MAGELFMQTFLASGFDAAETTITAMKHCLTLVSTNIITPGPLCIGYGLLYYGLYKRDFACLQVCILQLTVGFKLVFSIYTGILSYFAAVGTLIVLPR